MKKELNMFQRISISFITLVIIEGILGQTVGNIVQDQYLSSITEGAENILLIMASLLLMGSLTGIMYKYIHLNLDHNWFHNTMKFAVPFGLITFFSTHLFQSGYTNLNVFGWAIEGALDSLGPIITIIMLSYFTKRKRIKQQ